MKHLGKQSKQPTSPNIKILDKVKNNMLDQIMLFV